MIELLLKYVNQPVSVIVIVCVFFYIDHSKIQDSIRRIASLEKKCGERHKWCLNYFRKDK